MPFIQPFHPQCKDQSTAHPSKIGTEDTPNPTTQTMWILIHIDQNVQMWHTVQFSLLVYTGRKKARMSRGRPGVTQTIIAWINWEMCNGVKTQQQKLKDWSRCSGPYYTNNNIGMEQRGEKCQGALVKKKDMLLKWYNWKSTDLHVQRYLPLWMRNFTTM